jgi:uncharacterized protein (TIGR00369 family)
MDKKTLPRFSKCFVCGNENKIGINTEFHTNGEEVYTGVTFSQDYVGYDNVVHGGVISALLDETAMWACYVKTGKLFFTIELNIRFKRKLPPNIKTNVTGKLIQLKKSYAISESKLMDDQGNVYAVATGKYFPIPKDEMKTIWDYLEK